MARKINLSEKDDELYKDVKKIVKQVNQRLVRLERQIGDGSWATKRLIKKLDIPTIEAITGKKRVSIRKSMTRRQLNAIKKASKEFIVSETATPKGYKNVIKKQKEGLRRSLSPDYEDAINSLSDDDIETIMQIFKDADALDIMQDIPSSDFVSVIGESIIQKSNKNSFLNKIDSILSLDYMDDEYKKKLIRVYNKFVKK